MRLRLLDHYPLHLDGGRSVIGRQRKGRVLVEQRDP